MTDMGLDVKYDLREITKDVTSWCDEVYPTRTRDQMIAKLKEELHEWLQRPLDAWELADLFIIALDLSNEMGFDLGRLIAHKMDINKHHRKWEVNEQGLLKHVKIARHPEGGDDQAVAHREHGSAADECRASAQCSDLGADDMSAAGDV